MRADMLPVRPASGAAAQPTADPLDALLRQAETKVGDPLVADWLVRLRDGDAEQSRLNATKTDVRQG